MTSSIIRPRLSVGHQHLIGPGKIDLLRAVRDTGSISAAARATGLGYRRAWSLLDEIRVACGVPVVDSAAGGAGGGGAALTPFAVELLRLYDAIEADCQQAAVGHLKKIDRLLKKPC